MTRKIIMRSGKYSPDVPVGSIMTVTKEHSNGNAEATLDGSGEDIKWFVSAKCFDEYTPETPTLWRDMTDAEKGALLLAHHEGKVIEWHSTGMNVWHECARDSVLAFTYNFAYRIKPVQKAVTRHAGSENNWLWTSIRDEADTHRITFNTIDGKPDCDSIKMEVL